MMSGYSEVWVLLTGCESQLLVGRFGSCLDQEVPGPGALWLLCSCDLARGGHHYVGVADAATEKADSGDELQFCQCSDGPSDS